MGCQCTEHLCERARNKLSPMLMFIDAYRESPFEDDYLNKMSEAALQSCKELTRIIKQCEEG